MTPQVEAFVGPAHDLIHTSLVLTGLCALAERGAITLRYRYPRSASDRWLAGDPMVVVLDVHAGSTMRVAIDLRDGEGISRPIVERVQWYFKRAFYPPERDRSRHELGDKLQPFGLNYGCRTISSTARLLAAIGGPIALTGRAGVQRLRQYLLVPPPRAFEQDPSIPVEPAVAFQTRLWGPAEIPPDEVEPLNEERLLMVRTLKREFGPRFVGGLVPTPLARQRYPDDLTPHSSKYAEYLKVKKRCLISVYTRGVEHSLAFKLGETFAASQCLVSVPLRYELPEPLEPERHYLGFETADECVAACRRLLDDATLAQQMRANNHRYYAEQVEPAAHLSVLLRRVTAGER
jgi:hypothetical protein